MKDGSVIRQDAADTSKLDPGVRSTFYDVCQHPSEVEVFVLVERKFLGGHFYLVDLRDGHFEIDGTPFWAIPTDKTLSPGGTFSLVYYRIHQHDLHVTATVMDDMSINEVGTPGEHRVSYCLGWRYTLGSDTYTQTIIVN